MSVALSALVFSFSIILITSAQSTATITEISATCSTANATWTTWGAWNACNVTCGICETQQRIRTCTTRVANCPCSGSANETQTCGEKACRWPRKPCCSGTLGTGSDGDFACSSSGRK